jgi:L-ribulokinase
MCGVKDKFYRPNPKAQAVYAELYPLYRALHDAFGTREWSGRLDTVMKDLIRIRERQRAGSQKSE